MREYYEPMLYLSTPEHPNTMGVYAVLREPVDGGLLREAAEELRARFPYFYVKAVTEGGDLVLRENPLPMTVRGVWTPIDLNAEASNFHLAAWKHEGKRVAFEISHSLTDGAGVLPYFKSALYLYLSRKTGRRFDPAGFRLPGQEIPESETGNPFASLDIDAAEAPFYKKAPAEDFYRFGGEGGPEERLFCVRFSEEQLMRYCRDFDGSPNAFFAVMLARAVRRYDPESSRTVSVCVAIDYKAALGNHDNYRMFANTLELDFPKDRPLDDILKSCTIARGQLMLQAQPENVLFALKQRKMLYAKLDQVPLETKLGAMARSAGAKRWSLSVSYANSRTFGPLDLYIEELYVLCVPGVTDVLCEITCIGGHFFLAVAQSFASEKFLEALLEELSLVGLDYEVMRKEPLGLCSIAPYQST